MTTPLIRLYAYTPECLTWEEFEEVKRDVEARILAGCPERGDTILARLLLENMGRYYDVKAACRTSTAPPRAR